MEDTIILSILISIFGLLLGIILNTLISINNRLSDVIHALDKGEINPGKLNEIKEILIELKGVLNMLTLNRNQQDRQK